MLSVYIVTVFEQEIKKSCIQNRLTEKIRDFVGLRAEITSAAAARGNNFIASSCLKHECRVTNYFSPHKIRQQQYIM